MRIEDYVKHPLLAALVKRIEAGDSLFQQGQMASTMFIILEGMVELVSEEVSEEYVEDILGPGQFLGEKAMLQDAPYQRLFGARAITDTVALEITLRNAVEIQKTAPAIMSDIFRRAFQIAIERLHKSNYLVRILRSSNNIERLAHCVLFFCRTSGKRVPEGVEVELPLANLQHYIDMEKSEILECFSDLISLHILVKRGENLYLVSDENALLHYAAREKKRAA